MRFDNELKLDFDDVLIRPKWSKAPSRKNVDLTETFQFLNSGAIWNCCPIVASNMATIGTLSMARELAKVKMMTCIHKFYPLEALKSFFEEEDGGYHVFYTTGIKDEDFEKLDALTNMLLGPISIPFICVDAANGYTQFFHEKVQKVRDGFNNATIMAGNVCTPEMVERLLLSGAADIVKIGIGPGSVCTTRLVTGVGYPQLSAIIECADAAHGIEGHICADGGCRTSGDIAKAFGAGADFVMLGGLLAGTNECPGQRFYGMSSEEAMEKHNGGMGTYRAAEGKSVDVPSKGPVSKVLQGITGGLKSACTYVGTEHLKHLSKCTTFVRVNRTHNSFFGD